MTFSPLIITPHPEGWGPPVSASSSTAAKTPTLIYPFEANVKPEKLGRACDFTYMSYQRAQKEGRAPPEEKTDFRLVDSRPVKSQYQPRRMARRPFVNPRGMAHQQQQANATGRGRQNQQQQRGRGGTFGPGAWGGRPWQNNQRWGFRRNLAEWSIEPATDWQTLQEIQLAKLPKQKLEIGCPNFKDIAWCGELRAYQKEYDLILSKAPIPLKDHRKNLEFYQAGTMADDLITSTLQDMEDVKVAATDQSLACLMAASQSKMSWHLNVTKVENKIIIDKTDGSTLDMLTVGETARDPPNPECPTRINRPGELAMEAMRINQDFQQQVLKLTGDAENVFERAPFIPANEVPAKKVYRYRLVTLPGKPSAPTEFGKQSLTLVVRAEIDGVLPGMADGNKGYLTARAFNEYDFHSGKPWRVQIENQKGGLFATESRNNACKLGKWVAQALIAGSDQLRLGFVSRVSPTNNQSHEVLFVQSHRTEELAGQIGMKQEIAWGQVRWILDIFGALPDGFYVLVKDPLKPVIRLYKPPEEAVDAEAEVLLDTYDTPEKQAAVAPPATTTQTSEAATTTTTATAAAQKAEET